MTLSQEAFIAKCEAAHNGFYDYSITQYVKTSEDVEIICPTHGIFVQKAARHLAGKGCPLCGEIKRHQSNVITAGKKFMRTCGAIHEAMGREYSYEKTVYVRNKKKVTVTCLRHGDFLVTPHAHLRGFGCKQCSKEDRSGKTGHTREQFLASIRDSQVDGRYDYTQVDYKNSKTPVTIICPEHGPFTQAPSCHRRGSGCRKCAEHGYRPNRTGTLYVLYFDGIVKVGITNNAVRERVTRISRSSGLPFIEALSLTFKDGSIPLEAETILLRHLKDFYEQPGEKFEGSTEAFVTKDLLRIMDMAAKLTESIQASKIAQEALNQ